MRRVLLLSLAVTACSDGTAPAPAPEPNPVAGTYSEYAIDGQQLPVSTPQDTCQRVNTGGWLSLTAEGAYVMALDKSARMCNGVLSGADYVAQRGTYQFASDTVITFVPAAGYGPRFAATFDAGTYQRGQGGRLRNLRFDFGAHSYWVIEDVPAAPPRTPS